MLTKLFELARDLHEDTKWPTYDGGFLDRTEFLTSSEVSKCLRWSFFAKNPDKFPPPVGTGGANGFADRGHAIEAYFVERIKSLEKIGYKFEYMGEDQRSFYDPDIGISGTPDGLMTDPNGLKWLLELKSIDPRFNKNNLPKKGHIPQTNQNMHLVKTCLGIELAGGILFYIDASNVWDVREFSVEFSEELLAESTQRAESLWAAKEPDDLEAEGVYTGDCDLCPFVHHCSQTVDLQKRLTEVAKLQPTFFADAEPTALTNEQSVMVQEFLSNRADAASYEKAKDKISGDVKKLVMDNGGFIKTADGTVLTADMSAGRSSIDKDALTALGVDLDAVTKQGKPFVTLNVKEPKK